MRNEVALVARQVYYEQLNFWFNPVAAIFTVGFSVLFLILLGSSAGNSHSSTLGGVKVINYYVPGFVAYGVMSTCFNSLSSSLVTRRESGLLKRLRLSPLPTWAFLCSVFVSVVIISLVQVVILLVMGRFAYGVGLPANLGALVVVLIVGTASFSAIGVAVSTLIPNQEAAGPLVSIVFFVLLFLSGLWFPISSSSGLGQVSGWMPVRHMLLAVYAPFGVQAHGGGSPWPWGDMLAMALWGAAGVLVALRRWSWAPRRTGQAGRLRGPFGRRASAID
ncbi:MAG: ABC transporter permease [Acidimicrobiales bacterium]